MASEQSVRSELEKVLASECFAQAERLRNFLRFTVEHTLKKPDQPLKEYVIGTDVYGRDASFDPRIDAVVRVDATRLRAKLNDYYATEGTNDPVRISLPKGTYTPVFSTQGLPIPAAKNQASDASIAVLPFLNLSAAADTDYFSDGLTEELIHVLAQIPGLRVIARTSAFAFKGRHEDVRDIGTKLRVRYLLEGTVRQHAGSIRVTAQLINCADGFHLWSRRYDHQLANIFEVQDAIACELARAISVDMPSAKGSNAQRASGNWDAYQLLLKARFHWNRNTAEGFRKSISYLQEALAVDPRYARAWVHLGDNYNLLGMWGIWPPQKAFPQAKDAALRAIEIDPTLGDAHKPLAASLALYEWRWDEAERGFRRALALNPADEQAYHALAMTWLLPQGRFAEALDALQTAESLDPLSLFVLGSKSSVLYCARRFQEAAAQCRKALDLDAEYWGVLWSYGRILEHFGDFEEALPVLERAVRNSGNAPGCLGSLGHCYSAAGQRRKATEVLGQLETLSGERYVSPFEPAQIHAGLGDSKRALECLEKAVDERAAWIVYAGVTPILENLHADPRFTALLKRMGLKARAEAASV
ncbi:MAG: tetratricopeptide repeat protein [Acidobacteriia bacterium]|nr:tetratricopeptide repeat protein [Terriglobia bacterium]MBV9742167.1 tetratricopeptide repeat protein [Terriglobia bacterium]